MHASNFAFLEDVSLWIFYSVSAPRCLELWKTHFMLMRLDVSVYLLSIWLFVSVCGQVKPLKNWNTRVYITSERVLNNILNQNWLVLYCTTRNINHSPLLQYLKTNNIINANKKWQEREEKIWVEGEKGGLCPTVTSWAE